MGKASSSKKVARAARAGSRSSGPRQRNLLFPSAIGAIILLGVGLIAYAANDRKTDDSVAPVAFEDHWHAAYGIYVCDEFLPAIPTFEEPNDIHTHGDGVIHIHPFSEAAAGDKAELGVFLDGAQVELSDDELTVGDDTWTEGEDQCGEGDDAEDGELVVAQWRDVQTDDGNPALIDSDFGDVRFREDGEGYTIAFVPEGTEPGDIPMPDTASQLAELGAVDAGGATSTTGIPGDTTATTVVPGDTTGTTAGAPTETTLGDTTATTTGG